MIASDGTRISLGEDGNLMTTFSFGDTSPIVTGKENIPWNQNVSMDQHKYKKYNVDYDDKVMKSKPPANLFKPWVGNYINQKANKKLASELQKFAFQKQNPKDSKKTSNKVLQVYRSNRASSQASSSCGSSRGSSTLSKVSYGQIALRGSVSKAVDPVKVKERCDKYYSDYLRVRINKRPSDCNMPTSTEDSLSQTNSSQFLGKVMINCQNFYPHISIMTQQSFDSQNDIPGRNVVGCKAIPGPRLSDRSYSQLVPEIHPATSYGFLKRKSSEKLREKRDLKKHEYQQSMRPSQKVTSILTTSRDFKSPSQKLCQKINHSPDKLIRPAKKGNSFSSNIITKTNKLKQNNILSPNSKSPAIKNQPNKKSKHYLFTAINLFSRTNTSGTIQPNKEQKCKDKPKFTRLKSLRNSPINHLPKPNNHNDTSKLPQYQMTNPHPQEPPKVNPKPPSDIYPNPTPTPLKHQPPSHSTSPAIQRRYFTHNTTTQTADDRHLPVKDKLAFIHNLAALKAYMRSRSLER